MAYATIADVKDRTTRAYTPDEERVVELLLEDAAVMIDSCNAAASEDAKKIVSCRMVIRAVGDGGDYGVPVGASQGSMAAGGYSQSWTYGTGASGELYLGKADKALLGASNRIGSYSPVEDMT